MITNIQIIRPDLSVPFFYEIADDRYREFSNGYQENGQIISITNSMYNNDLTFEMTIIYSSPEDSENFHNAFVKKFPDFINERAEYCQKHGHVLTIDKIKI
jgi:hypothetical protein